MTGFTPLWGVLLLAGGALELVALLRKRRGETLSSQVWMFTQPSGRQWSLKLPPWWIAVSRTTVGVVLVWLMGHFMFGWWTL